MTLWTVRIEMHYVLLSLCDCEGNTSGARIGTEAQLYTRPQQGIVFHVVSVVCPKFGSVIYI